MTMLDRSIPFEYDVREWMETRKTLAIAPEAISEKPTFEHSEHGCK
jgi:hypothetical protein